MKFTPTPLAGAYLIELNPFEDHRGFFSRLYCKEAFGEIGHQKEIVQANYSRTNKAYSIRGLHFQMPPYAETKILKCVRGRLLDLIVDVRKGSPTFLQYFGVELSADKHQLIYAPEGFAHGFQSLEDNTETIYFSTAPFHKESERGVRYNDPRVDIRLFFPVTDISAKDANIPLLSPDFEGVELK